MSDELGLESDDYWASPEVSMDVFRKLREADFQGLKIGAPALIATDLRQTAPMLLYRAGSYRDLAELDFPTHAIVTIMDLDRNEVSNSYAASRVQRAPGKPQDPATVPEGYSASTEVIDLIADAKLPRRPGTYLVTAVMRDRVSNRLRVQVQASGATYQDPEVARLLRAERRKKQAPPISPAPGHPLPSYGPQPGTPAVPEQPGLELAADRVTILREGASCVLRGAFRVAAAPEEVVKPGDLPWLRPGALRPTAVVRIHLLVVGSTKPSPALLHLDVPSADPVDPAADAPVVSGRFNVDLLRLPLMPKGPQTYFVYGFAGEAMVGPIPVALVGEDALPQRR